MHKSRMIRDETHRTTKRAKIGGKFELTVPAKMLMALNKN